MLVKEVQDEQIRNKIISWNSSEESRVTLCEVVRSPDEIVKYRPYNREGKPMSIFDIPTQIRKTTKGVNDSDFWFDPSLIKDGDFIGIHKNKIRNAMYFDPTNGVFFLRPEYVFFVYRNEEFLCPGAYCIVEPIQESEDDCKTASGIYFKSAPAKEQYKARILAKGYDPFGDAEDINVGDVVILDVKRHSLFFRGKEYWRPRWRNFMAIQNGDGTIRPLSNRLIVSPEEDEQKVASGLVIISNAKPKARRGHVVNTGPNTEDVKSGQQILFNTQMNTALEHNGQIIMREGEVLGVMN